MRRRMFRYFNRPGLEFVSGCACFISATFFIASVLLSPWNGVPAAPALTEPIAVGPPPALPPGQAPPLPNPGPLAEPRSSNDVGSQPTAPSLVPLVTIQLAPSPTAGPCQSASTAASANATPQPC